MMKKMKDMIKDELVALAIKKMDDTGICGGDECIDMYINGVKDALRDQTDVKSVNTTKKREKSITPIILPGYILKILTRHSGWGGECTILGKDFDNEDDVTQYYFDKYPDSKILLEQYKGWEFHSISKNTPKTDGDSCDFKFELYDSTTNRLYTSAFYYDTCLMVGLEFDNDDTYKFKYKHTKLLY